MTAQDSLLAFFDNCLERVSVSTFLYFQFLLLVCLVHMSYCVFSSYALILRLMFHDLFFSGSIHSTAEIFKNAVFSL